MLEVTTASRSRARSAPAAGESMIAKRFAGRCQGQRSGFLEVDKLISDLLEWRFAHCCPWRPTMIQISLADCDKIRPQGPQMTISIFSTLGHAHIHKPVQVDGSHLVLAHKSASSVPVDCLFCDRGPSLKRWAIVRRKSTENYSPRSVARRGNDLHRKEDRYSSNIREQRFDRPGLQSVVFLFVVGYFWEPLPPIHSRQERVFGGKAQRRLDATGLYFRRVLASGFKGPRFGRRARAFVVADLNKEKLFAVLFRILPSSAQRFSRPRQFESLGFLCLRQRK